MFASLRRKTLLLAVIGASLTLTGCEKPVSQMQQSANFVVEGVNPPKRFYVDLRNVTTGERFNVYVAKRCSNWRKLAIGSVHRMNTEVSVYSDGTKRTYFINKSSLCPRS